jgi:hypothetical protein
MKTDKSFLVVCFKKEPLSFAGPEARKRFFFEKKNQKTFIHLGRCV